jgi:hypothetical protein
MTIASWHGQESNERKKNKELSLALSLSLSLLSLSSKETSNTFFYTIPKYPPPMHHHHHHHHYHSCNNVPNKKKPSIFFANFKHPKLTISFLLALPTTTKARILCSDSL